MAKDPFLPRQYFWTRKRIVSGLIALSYIVVSGFAAGAEGLFKMAMFCVLPLACIWFPELLANYTGFALMRGPAITRSSPPGCVFVLGWLILLLPPIQVLVMMLIDMFQNG